MPDTVKRIFAIGRGANEPLIGYFARLTGKSRPRICHLPTATGDCGDRVDWWMDLGERLDFEPVVQKIFVSSFHQKERFEEVLLNVDAIYVGGGNTLNMLAIWKVQGIDVILRKAWELGIVLGGGSAGGICWFENGLTDSRPRELTAMNAMGWLKGSFAPHYLSEPGRRTSYHKLIQADLLSDGYGVDEPVGLLFENETLVKAVGSTQDAQAFHVRKTDDGIIEQPLEIEYAGND